MSNTAADTVSAPVDGIAWLLRAAGIPVPQNAIGSSAWMAQHGLTAPVQPGASKVAGETLGLLSPVVAAAKAPQIARGLLQGADNLLAPSTQGAMRQRGALISDNRLNAMKLAKEQGYRDEWHMGFSGPAFDAIDPSLRGSITDTPASKIATFLTDSKSDAMDFAINASKKTGKQPNVMNIGVSGRMGTVTWKDTYPQIRSEGGQRYLAGILQDAKDSGYDAIRIVGANDSISGTSSANVLAVLNEKIMRDMNRAKFNPAFKGQNGLTLGVGGLGVAGLLGEDQ